MPMNRIEFQPALSVAKFQELNGTEEQCPSYCQIWCTRVDQAATCWIDSSG